MEKTANFTKTINGIECVLVKAGTFTMGGSNFGESPSCRVTISKDYWIGKYSVTQAQYLKIIGKNPSNFKGKNNPVECVNWYEAKRFCDCVGNGCRLPTEAEWEFAARGGKKSKGYIYSGSNNLDEVGWYHGNSSGSTHSVGQKNPNELGIYDMSGNVWEWCSDWFGSYTSAVVTNPTGLSTGSYRTGRGGSWRSGYGQCLVVYHRDGDVPSFKRNRLGFRVAFD